MFTQFPIRDRYIIAGTAVKEELPVVIINQNLRELFWQTENYIHCNNAEANGKAIFEGYLVNNRNNKRRVVISANTDFIPQEERKDISPSVLNRCCLRDLIGISKGWYRKNLLIITDIMCK